MADRNALLDRLNKVHTFPGPYIFKVIGHNSPEFISRVVQAALNVLGRGASPSVSTRESSRGKHLSVTLSVKVEDAESVLELYSVLQTLEGVRFLL